MFAEICQLLDRLHPTHLAVDRQTARLDNGETWIRLVHAHDHDADLDIALGNGPSNIYGLCGHDEEYRSAGECDDTWKADTIETLTALLMGCYLIENLSWRGRPYRTQVTDLVGDARGGISLYSALGFLPLPRRAVTVTGREVDYGCTGS